VQKIYSIYLLIITCALLSVLSFINMTSKVRLVSSAVKTHHSGKIQFRIDLDLLHGAKNFPKPVTLIMGVVDSSEFAVDYYPVLPWGLDLNRAGRSLLTIVHGIGPATADRIVMERERNGKFRDMPNFLQRTHLAADIFSNTGNWIYVGED